MFANRSDYRVNCARATRRRVACQTVVALALSVGIACASAGVESPADQTRKGVLAADQGYWEEAAFRWLKALSVAEMDARALNNLGVRQERAGEFESAHDFYERALRVASPAEHFYVERNWKQFEPIWERIESGDMTGGDEEFDLPVAELPQGESPDVGAIEIAVSVPDQGPNLAGYDRLLIGNFAKAPESEANLNDLAVRYMRRRITQRTFFETQDQLESPLEPERQGDGLLADPDYWAARAAGAEADLVLTGYLGFSTRADSQMVRERIRSPDGEIREVARFRDSVVYTVTLEFYILRGEDGATLLDGNVQAEQSFPADEGISESEAVFETLEQLLPEVLDAITPRRTEQTRYLIY
jgi:tetratricopeptide (TPR) repeat protein